ncbi:uncharacterized protein LOC107871739 [Capsicum annuum]|uniref:uncharacterized protein LOC107871739 n=1 Tax=Capsicum annuum TaxID=4072 RepID=UPI001FB10C74|nr:uncharacterized protein LOC107871739 [Capsicum annuum]
MRGFRYNEDARMIVSMSISTSYVELVAMLHEKMRTNGENIQMDISGKYPCSFQEKMRITLICVMMHMLKFVMKIRRKMNLQKMMEKVKSQKKSFSELPKFFAAFQHFNHGTIVEWKHEESMSSLEVKTYKFVFWAFNPCIDGFRTCRPVISVDGTHLYGKYEIKLLIAVGIDGNDNILPLAFAIVDRESKEAWKWFFRKLSAHVIKDREDACIISDRAKGILASLSELWQFQEPRAFHQFCVRHLKSNFQSYFPKRNLSDLMWNAASTHQKARGLPVTAMVRLSLEKIVERYTRRSQIVHQLVEQKKLWTSRFKVNWEKNYESSKKHFVFDWNISTGTYEVRSIQVDGTGGNPHRVSLNDKKCDCGKWANLHFSCSHVMKVTERMGGLARNFVSEHFTTENYVATYFGSFSPVGHEAYWPSPSFIMRSNEFYRHPMRQRTTRVPTEMDHGPAVYGRACGLCRQNGHDRSRCPTHNQT